MNVLDHPVTWEKGEVNISILGPVNVVTSLKKQNVSIHDMTFKTDLLADVDERVQPDEEALSQVIDE